LNIIEVLTNIYTILFVVGLGTLIGLFQLRSYVRKPDIHISLGRGKLSIQDSTKSIQVSLLLAFVINRKSFFGDYAKQISVNLLYRTPINDGEIGLNSIIGLPFLKEAGADNFFSNIIQNDKDVVTNLEATYFQRLKVDIPQGRSETIVVAYRICEREKSRC
jgi:hypothetical protein